MYELNPAERMLLAAIGADGLPFRAIRKLVGSDLTVLERLCDLGYVWTCDPDDGPFYVLKRQRPSSAHARPVSGATARRA